jgi:hypothetical protein
VSLFKKQAYRTIILYIQTDPIMLTPATWGLLVWYSLLLAYLDDVMAISEKELIARNHLTGYRSGLTGY